MTKLTNQREIQHMTLLCAAVYFTSYLSRINFGAVILEIVQAEGWSKPEVSLAVTISFVTYGVGQLASGWLGDKVSPRLLIFIGLLMTAAMNLLIPFCPGAGPMSVVWGINGFAQALLWPPLVKTMISVFTDEVYRQASVRVSWGSSFGTIAVYLAAPLCILLSGWRSVFLIAAGACAVMAVVWLVACGRVEKRLGQDRTEPPAARLTEPGLRASTGTRVTLAGIMVAIICQGALRDGVTTWMPSLIAETYQLGSSVSILTGVILPVFSIVCFQLAHWLNNRLVRSELLLSGEIFLVGAACAVLLRLTASWQAALSVILSAALTGGMHGINLLLICMIPPHFARYGNVSAISGSLNACTYVGSALSTYGTAFLSDRFGWNVILSVWAGTALVGAAVCIAFSKRWERIRLKD